MNKSEIYDALMTVSNLFGLSSEKDEWTKITQQYIQVHSLIEKYSNKKDVVKKKYFSWQSNDTPKQKIAFTGMISDFECVEFSHKDDFTWITFDELVWNVYQKEIEVTERLSKEVDVETLRLKLQEESVKDFIA